jgi:hypothetical protein
MPANVTFFERLMYASVCVGLAIVAIDGPRQAAAPEFAPLGGPIFFVVTVLGTLGLFVLLIWLIARRRKNWARYLLAGLFVLGLWPFLQNFWTLIDANPLIGTLSGVQLALQMAALYAVFTDEAAAWFANA